MTRILISVDEVVCPLCGEVESRDEEVRVLDAGTVPLFINRSHNLSPITTGFNHTLVILDLL